MKYVITNVFPLQVSLGRTCSGAASPKGASGPLQPGVDSAAHHPGFLPFLLSQTVSIHKNEPLKKILLFQK